MSVEATSWVLNFAPVNEPALRAVLVGLANHADPDGTAAFPAVETLMRYSGYSRRTVQRALQKLVRLGVIKRCDQKIVAAYIDRADRRPVGYDIVGVPNLNATESEIEGANGASPLRPAPENGVSPLHPADGNGASLTTSRGVTVTPEPSKNHSLRKERPGTSNDAPDHTTRGDSSSKRKRRDHRSLYDDAHFARFWELYPRKAVKGEAAKAWMQVTKHTEPARILEGLERHLPGLRAQAKENITYVRHPATWLRGDCWDDAVEVPAPGADRAVLGMDRAVL